ncbi:MAG TPA: ATP-binding protein [Dongiaceae bacterium]|nr:ATP-binding protein [Dongiaceae bacterium]
MPDSGDVRSTAARPSVASAAMNGHTAERPFNLLRWFSVASLLCVSLISAASAVFLSRFLTEHMLQRDAVVSMEFIDGIVQVEDAIGYFVRHDRPRPDTALDSFFQHVSRMPDVVRANVYARDRSIIWSSTAGFEGRKFGPNAELDRAFAGVVQVESGTVGSGKKAEHVSFAPMQPGLRFVEAYLPIRDAEQGSVVGVVEIYKLPHALFRAIDEGRWLVWTSAAIGGLFLYATLFWIVRRASGVIRAQQAKLIDTERFAAMGEMASAVAHGIRNPLASIRSSAELALADDPENAREFASDIVAEADRMDKWVRDLLLYARSDGPDLEAVDINEVVRESLHGFGPAMERQNVAVTVDAEPALPPARGNGPLLGQVLNGIVANALEAMPGSGRLTVTGRLDAVRGAVDLRIADNGPGLSADKAAQVFRPFFTTKRSGLGLGLALSRRIVGRFGGTLDLASVEGQGTTVTIRLPVAG